MEATLYVNTSDNKVINKTLQMKKTVDLQSFKQFNIINPVFIMKYDNLVFESNYIYVPVLKRYYFIKNIEVVTGSIIHLQCAVDVLESFKDQYLLNPAILKRSEKYFNLYLNDSQFQAINPSQTSTKILDRNVEFSPGSIGTNTKNYVLTVARGR